MRFLWYFLVFLIAILGLIIYSLGYNRSFNPEYEIDTYIDEARLYQEAIEMRYLPAESRTLAGYPPGLLWLFQIAHSLTNHLANQQNQASLSLVRLLAALINGFTLILLALIGRSLLSPAAGIMAMMAWLFAPFVLERVHFAMTEPYQVFFLLLSVYAALQSLRLNAPVWAIFSLVFALIALVFKYSNFPALGFGTGVAVYHLFVLAKPQKRVWAFTFFVQLLLILATALWFYFAYDTQQLVDRPEAAHFLATDTAVINLKSFQTVFSEAIRQIGWQPLPFVIIYLLGTALFIKQNPNHLRYLWLMMSIFVFSYLGLVTFYIVFWSGVHRYTTPVSSILVVIASISILQSLEWLVSKLNKLPRRLAYTIFLLPYILWITPLAYQTSLIFPRWQTPHTSTLLANWTAVAAHDSTINIPDGWYPLFDFWGGYTGATQPWVSEPLSNRSIEEWQSLNVLYAVLTESQRNSFQSSSSTATYLDDILLIKEFAPIDAQNWGDALSVYYFGLPDTEMNLVFGNSIRLFGYSVLSQELRSGGNLSLQTFWQATALPQEDYFLFLHLVSGDSLTPISQVDALPSLMTYPPTQWTDFDEIIVGETLSLSLPSDLESGEYRVLMGLYSPTNLQRLLSSSGADFVELMRFTLP